MPKASRTGPRKFYKGKYGLAFYDKTDERFLYVFDNVKEILQFENREINRHTVHQVNKQLYKALKSEEHFIMLNGIVTRVYLVELEEDENI